MRRSSLERFRLFFFFVQQFLSYKLLRLSAIFGTKSTATTNQHTHTHTKQLQLFANCFFSHHSSIVLILVCAL